VDSAHTWLFRLVASSAAAWSASAKRLEQATAIASLRAGWENATRNACQLYARLTPEARRWTFTPAGRPLGGIDFGFRNPFAALWGVLDRGGVLWLTGEHYERLSR
jgi:hypothetical protein